VPIQLYFSNQLDTLAEKYATVVDLETRLKENIFEGPLTIVPNQNLVKWLQLTLSAKRSIFMNVDFQYLESGLWALLTRIDPNDEPPEMMTAAHVRMFLLSALIKLDTADDAVRPLSRYLLEPDGTKGSGYAVRLWQLVERMVRLFEAYQFHRSDMLKNWRDSKYVCKGMERCQQGLYLRMIDARDRYVQAARRPLLWLSEYADKVLQGDRGRAGPSRIQNTFVHLFGLSQVSPFHLDLIGRLSGHCRIFIYSLNPCREFWEDIRTPQEKKWIQRRAVRKLAVTPEEQLTGELAEPEENTLLGLWGRPGREHIRLLCQLTDYDFEACFSRPKRPETVLRAVQRRIFTLSTEEQAVERRRQDRSLQIVACPGIYREVETVYNSIIYNLEADPRLQLTDIAVFVPDMSVYKPAIDSVFNRRPRRLSYNLVDSRADIESVYGQAVLGILDMAGGRFSRKEVFDLILNPCFMHKWDIRSEDAAVWARWADGLHIFHSFDAGARARRGYPDGDAYTWRQGLQRLRLSRILSVPEAPIPDPGGDEDLACAFPSFEGRVPFEDLQAGDPDLVEKFSVAVERLHHGVAQLTDLWASGIEWAERLMQICHDLLSVPPGLRGESAVHNSLVSALWDLAIYDQVQGSEERLDVSLIRELVKSNLASISGGYGDYLTEGVTISSLQPMRPIPFRIVYVMGMQEGAFPGRAETSSLDLRLVRRRIGDVTLPERNCYLFLEMLLSVEDKLYLTYVARDLQKDRMIQPCSVVNQLRRYVEEEILPEAEGFQTAEAPLKGSSRRYVAPDAVNEISDVAVNYSLSDRIACYLEAGLWDAAAGAVPEALKDRIQGCFPDLAIARAKAEKDEQPLERITIKQLRMFLEDPVSQCLRRHLGILEEETLQETAAKEDEPFYAAFPLDYDLKMSPLKLWLDRWALSGSGPGSIEAVADIYEAVYEDRRRRSMTPEGAFARVDKKALLEDLHERVGSLCGLLDEMGRAETRYRGLLVGEPTGETIPASRLMPLLRLDPLNLMVATPDDQGRVSEVAVEIHGQLPWVWRDPAGGWHALVVSGSSKTPGKAPDRYIFEPLLFWLACGLVPGGRDLTGDGAITFHVAYRKKTASWTYRPTLEAARAYLSRLVSDCLSRERPRYLPFKAAASQSIKPHLIPDDGIREGDRESFYVQLRDAYSEETSALVRLADPLVPEDAFDRMRERFRIFFAAETSDKR